MDLALRADQRVKLKESEKKKKLWNMEVTIISIVIGTLRTVTKGLVQGMRDIQIKGPVKAIQTTALLRSARILRRVLET